MAKPQDINPITDFGSDNIKNLIQEKKKREEQKLNNARKKTIRLKYTPEQIRKMFENPMWNSEKVKVWDRLWDSQTHDEYGLTIFDSPYLSGIKGIKAKRANLPFEWTKKELEEIKKCKEDVCYFANNFIKAKTEDGRWRKITLRDYQYDILRSFQDDRNVIVLASRQIGKSVMAAIFILWYCIFEKEKNVVITSYVASAATMVVRNLQDYYLTLPFFLKPGVKKWLGGSMNFENSNTIVGQSTTIRSATGMTVDLLYVDELGKVHPNIAPLFLAAVMPTLSSLTNSKLLITSTPCYYPNGEFDRLYLESVQGKNDFANHRVDWWQVPGRDEAWVESEKQKVGELLFNREYGLQFFEMKDALVKGDRKAWLNKLKREFVPKNSFEMSAFEENAEHFKFDPVFDLDELGTGHFIISIDFADGSGRDYIVANIFQLQPMSEAAMRIQAKNNQMRRKEYVRLVQVGYFAHNDVSLVQFSIIFKMFVYSMFNSNNLKILFEINDNRYLQVLNALRDHDRYDYIMIARIMRSDGKSDPGIKLNPRNRQMLFFELGKRIEGGQVVIKDKETIDQINAFGFDKRGRFVCMMNHDDFALTVVNLQTFYIEKSYDTLVDDFLEKHGLYEKIDNHIKSVKMKFGEPSETTDDDQKFDMYDFYK